MQGIFDEKTENDHKGYFLIVRRIGNEEKSHIHHQLRYARQTFATYIHYALNMLLMEDESIVECSIIDLDNFEIIDSFTMTKEFIGKIGM